MELDENRSLRRLHNILGDRILHFRGSIVLWNKLVSTFWKESGEVLEEGWDSWIHLHQRHLCRTIGRIYPGRWSSIWYLPCFNAIMFIYLFSHVNLQVSEWLCYCIMFALLWDRFRRKDNNECAWKCIFCIGYCAFYYEFFLH